MNQDFKRYKAALAFSGITVLEHAAQLNYTSRSIYKALHGETSPELRKKILKWTDKVLAKQSAPRRAA